MNEWFLINLESKKGKPEPFPEANISSQSGKKGESFEYFRFEALKAENNGLRMMRSDPIQCLRGVIEAFALTL